MTRPPFISLDGIDGTGKSTQCALLVDWLQSLHLPVVRCYDPGGTILGDQLRTILLEHRHTDMHPRTEALLFMASRVQLVETIIRPALQEGRWVISDRFVLANVVYQGHAGGLNPEELWQIGQFSTQNLQPDLTFILDLPIEAAAIRRNRGADRMESRSGAYHEKVRQGFLIEAQKHAHRMKVIDASGTVDAIQRELREQIRSFFKPRGLFPVEPCDAV